MDCPICLENIDDVDISITNCNHYFHTSCLLKIIKNECPLCKKLLFIEVNNDGQSPVQQNDNFIDFTDVINGQSINIGNLINIINITINRINNTSNVNVVHVNLTNDGQSPAQQTSNIINLLSCFHNLSYISRLLIGNIFLLCLMIIVIIVIFLFILFINIVFLKKIINHVVQTFVRIKNHILLLNNI